MCAGAICEYSGGYDQLFFADLRGAQHHRASLQNCGRYFAQTGRVSAEYCDRTPLDGQSSCRSMGAFQQWTLKQADDPVFKVYRREYKRRFAWIKAGRISDSEFYAWSEQAREQKKKCDEGVITEEQFQRWLKES